MTWRTQIGERVLVGAEAELYRQLMGFMADAIELEIDDPEYHWSFGVRLFDHLEPLVRLDLLACVSWALLRETDTYPPLTAINECVVGAAFRLLDDCLAMEMESEDNAAAESSFWRVRVLAVFKQIGDIENLPDVECRDPFEWETLTETLSARILWDEDFNDADLYLDQSPEKGDFMKKFMAIDPDYFTAVPPSPSESDVPRLKTMIRDLYRGQPQ